MSNDCVDGKERDGDGKRTRKKVYSVRRLFLYIGRCWQHRKNKDRKNLHISYTIHFRNSGCRSGSCGVVEECLHAGDAWCEGLGMTLVFGNELDEAKVPA